MASIAQFLHDDALRRPITPLVDAREVHDTGGDYEQRIDEDEPPRLPRPWRRGRRGGHGLGRMRAPDFGRERPQRNQGDSSRDARSHGGRSRLAWRRAEVAEGDIVETLDTDFLIIGAGTAGLAAAGAAADLGLNFIACDKSNQVPETREYLGGVDTAYAKATT